MAEASDAGGTAQLSFKVKTSGDKSHTISMAETATVLDLKTKLAGEEFENVPVERQRLIYSGRVMKNDDALSVYKIKTGNTIHMVKSAASNPAPANPATSSTPTPPALPQNMASGTAANNLLAGLTGARFAGHANLPSRDIFGADGGMGAPPSEEQMADMLANPAIAQTMNEALNNPAFIDYIIQSNPMLSNMPNAREMLNSPFFRNMMTNPEAIRAAIRMRRGDAGAGFGGFPAPGATDTTPSDAPSSDATGTSANNNAAQNPFGFPNAMFGAPGAAGANPFAGLFPFGMPTAPQGAGATTGGAAAAGTTGTTGDAAGTRAPGSPAAAGTTPAAPANPFAALFGAPMPGANAANPFGLPPMTPEMMQQMSQMLGGMGSPTSSAPPDNRPPEERYAEQLRQLNDMGFYDFDRNVAALRRSGGSVQGAIEHLLSGS